MHLLRISLFPLIITKLGCIKYFFPSDFRIYTDMRVEYKGPFIKTKNLKIFPKKSFLGWCTMSAGSAWKKNEGLILRCILI